jgi:hypothetical protein
MKAISLGGLMLVLFAVSALADEADPALKVCEVAIKHLLKAPKSYERVSSAIVGPEVIVTYDAVNEYNAPLRDVQTCEFYKDKDKSKVALVPLGLRELFATTADIAKRTYQLRTTAAAKRLQQEAKNAEALSVLIPMRHLVVALEAAKVTTYPIPAAATKVVPLETMPTRPE